MSVRLSLLAASALVAASALPAHAIPFAGLVGGNQLVGFDSATPGTITSTVNVSGLNAGQSLVGIDVRPATGQFLGLSSDSNFYTINTVTGAASFIAPSSTAISGNNFGFAVNPVVDRIRIVSDTEQNLRVNPDTGVAIVDGSLAYNVGSPAVPAAGTTPATPAIPRDQNAGVDPNVTAVAYTNQQLGAAPAATMLFGIDTGLDTLVLLNPPNAGGLQTIGSLGVNASAVAGFDIVAPTDAYASLNVGGASNFYRINLTTGAASSVGVLGANVQDIAQAQIGAPAQAVPEPASMAVLGLSLVGLLAARRRQVG